MLHDGELSLLAAYDGREALEAVREHHPDLVLTDVMMPCLDGRMLCRTIKSDPATEGTPVVLMSAARGIDPGECCADGWIPKPFDIYSLTRTVRSLLVARGA